MVLGCEIFFDGDRQAGVLLRDERPTELATLIAFTIDAGTLYRAEQVTALGAGPADWTTFRYEESLTGTVTHGTRTATGVTIDGVVLERDAVPSYLGRRILVDLASREGDRASFRQLDEHGDQVVRDAELVRRGAEEIEVPGPDGVVFAERFDLLVGGQPSTSFWWDGTGVAVSDWTTGSMSVKVDDLETALADCPVRVAGVAREWVAGRPVS